MDPNPKLTLNPSKLSTRKEKWWEKDWGRRDTQRNLEASLGCGDYVQVFWGSGFGVQGFGVLERGLGD